MKRAVIIRALLLFFLLLVWGAPGCSENQPGKSYTIGVVNLNKGHDTVLLGFKRRLASLGYVEGQNINYVYNGARSNMAELEGDLREIINRNVDLIFSLTTPATKKTKIMTAETGIPVVFAPVFDPVRSGIVQSLMKPGSNLTGIKVGGNCGKALDWFLKAAPQVKNLSVPFNPNNRAAVQSLEDLQEAAEKIGISLIIINVNDSSELRQVLQNLPEETEGLWLLNSHFLVQNTDLFVEAAIRYKVPLGSSTSQVDGGVMVCYGQDTFRTGELAANLAHEIILGTSPANLPVEVTDFFLGINLKTADSIGIDISEDILHVADKIIRP